MEKLLVPVGLVTYRESCELTDMIKYVDVSNLKAKTNYHDSYGKKVMRAAVGPFFF